jgi:hypothetical protein
MCVCMLFIAAPMKFLESACIRNAGVGSRGVSKPAANDAARTAIKPITPRKSLPNQQVS